MVPFEDSSIAEVMKKSLNIESNILLFSKKESSYSFNRDEDLQLNVVWHPEV